MACLKNCAKIQKSKSVTELGDYDMSEHNPKGLICPRCNKRWIRANVRIHNLVCRSCGFIWNDPELLPEPRIIL